MNAPAGNWILHIDDNPVARTLTGRLLRRAGFHVVEAETGEEGLRLAADNPDLILLDLELPDITGFEVCRRIKRNPSTASIPVLHLSAALIERSDWVSALEGGADGYLSQPVDEGVLVATIRALLRARRAETEVRHAAQQWQATFDALSSAICLLDVDGRVARQNRAALKHGAALQSCLDAEGLTGRVRSGLRRETAEVQLEGCWYALTVDPVLDEQGNFTGAVAAFTDVTERQRMEQELKRSNAELEQFAYVASHDLQEPLRMVKSYLQLIATRYRGRLDADADEFIAYAVDGAARMKALIDDLLAYSRVGSRGGDLVAIESEAAFTQALKNLEAAIGEAQAVVTHDPLPRVTGDERQLVQLFQNLVGNAIKFRGSQPPGVHVRAERNGAAWVFSVRDNGIGIAPENQTRLFEIFSRLHTTTEYPGTGLGLAIAKRIVERHGGRIWVESALGAGATFRFSLPAGD